MNVNKLFSRLPLPAENRMPGFAGATGSVNTAPLTRAELLGKVVAVQFWTYTCINWLRTLPYIRAWADAYADHGLVVLGVHTPEFGVEHDGDNVRRAVRHMGIEYPVAIDNDYAVWNAFANRYWPALYLVDARGVIRHHEFGEGEYERSERIIQQLLADAGVDDVRRELVSVAGHGIEQAADWHSLQTPETYVGFERAERFASSGGIRYDEPAVYEVPERLHANQWALGGKWTIGREAAALHQAGGRIAYRFHARDLNLVMGPTRRATSVRFRVRVDGEPPGAAHGIDTDDEGGGTVSDPRLYQLVRQPGAVIDRTVEVEFVDPGLDVYVFTFG